MGQDNPHYPGSSKWRCTRIGLRDGRYGRAPRVVGNVAYDEAYAKGLVQFRVAPVLDHRLRADLLRRAVMNTK